MRVCTQNRSWVGFRVVFRVLTGIVLMHCLIASCGAAQGQQSSVWAPKSFEAYLMDEAASKRDQMSITAPDSMKTCKQWASDWVVAVRQSLKLDDAQVTRLTTVALNRELNSYAYCLAIGNLLLTPYLTPVVIRVSDVVAPAAVFMLTAVVFWRTLYDDYRRVVGR